MAKEGPTMPVAGVSISGPSKEKALKVFTPEQLQTAINSTLQDVEPEHNHAIIAAVDSNGARVVASFKMSPAGKWTFQAAAEHGWNGDNSVGAKVILSW